MGGGRAHMPQSPKFAASIVRHNSQIKKRFLLPEAKLPGTTNQEARLVWVQNVSTLAYCDYKVQKTRHILPLPLDARKLKGFQLQGGEAPLTPRPGALPLDPAGGSAPDPRYRLALHALAMCPSQTQILDLPLP